MQKLYSLLFVLTLVAFVNKHSYTQSVLDPNDPIVEYDSTHPPTQPAKGQIGKWVRTKIYPWSTPYKAYIYNGQAFRLRFPTSYNPSATDGKKYPLIIMFHGDGEFGPITDNESQLGQFARQANTAINSGIYDGYVLFMQRNDNDWSNNEFNALADIMDYMVANNKLDPFKVTITGLSAGGWATWDMLLSKTQYIASALPMSAASDRYSNATNVNKVKFTPIWQFQGSLDDGPPPNIGRKIAKAMDAVGANYTYTEYPGLGHGTWNTAYGEANFWPFILRANQANPWPLFGRTEFCPGDAINVTLGLPALFDGYQWRKDGNIISTATSNTLQVTTTGTYDARIKRGAIWSDWSPIPVIIKIKGPTITPPITVSGLMSDAIPAADGKNFVNIEIPDNGYIGYTWTKAGESNIIGTDRILKVTEPGNYVVAAREKFGCSSVNSPAFSVINANGTNPPYQATNLTANALSNTIIELDWLKKPNYAYNPTAFEVYRSSQSGGPYTFISQVSADSLSFMDKNLNADTKYYYVIRAINNNGAAPLSNEAVVITHADKTPPTAPRNVRFGPISNSSVTIEWDASTDDVGIAKYEVYKDGALVYNTTERSVIINGLNTTRQYSFYVKAKDASGNYSPISNTISTSTVLKGFHYKYYEGAWTQLPDFDTLTPLKEGTTQSIDLSVRNRGDNFGFLWEGFIKIPKAGTYTFYTKSDEGSKMWLGSYNANATPIVDNDGIHLAGSSIPSKPITLQPGIYPIAVAYFESVGNQSMKLRWSCKELFKNYVIRDIDVQYFNDTYTEPSAIPAAPTNIVATAINYNTIKINWKDNSDNETGFEIYRAKYSGGPYDIITTTTANITSYNDATAEAATNYYYKVQAINLDGPSGFADSPGLFYSYYDGAWTKLPAFDSLTATKTGHINNINLSPALSPSKYALKFEGQIKITTQGRYTFYCYSSDGSLLYIGGFDSTHLIVKNDGTHSARGKSGSISLGVGTYPIYVTYFKRNKAQPAPVLEVRYKGPGIVKNLIPDSVFSSTPLFAFARTSDLPGAPAVPANIKATTLSSSKISVTWQDAATDETEYQIMRSVGDSSKFKPLAILPVNSTSYTDTSLFGNITYYYRVVAVGPGGTSKPAQAFAKTANNPPRITQLSSIAVRYGVTTSIPLNATDADEDPLTYSLDTPLSFATLSTVNGVASLILTPSVENQNVYSNLKITVNDGNGGSDNTIFNLTVNDNYVPAINPISNYSMDENSSLAVTLNATDENATDAISWSVSNIPFAYTLVPVSNRSATLTLNPNFASAGTYTIQVTANDGKGGSVTKEFTLTVKDIDPGTKIYARFMNQNVIGSPWNSITGVTTNNLKDVNDKVTTVGLSLQTSWWATNNQGPATGDNSGIFPDAVMKDFYYFGYSGGPNLVTANVTGLDPSKRYNFTFYGGSVWSVATDNGSTNYTIGSTTVSLKVQNNTTNTTSISDIQPDANGTVSFTMTKGLNATAGYINALVISSKYDDHTTPSIPTNLKAQVVSQGIKLSWNDVAYNEDGYRIFKATSALGTFEQIGQVAENSTIFIDSNYTGNTNYFYKIQAYNAYGASKFSDVVTIATLNRIPKIEPINSVTLRNNESLTIQVKAIDDATDHLTLTASNLPPFATFTDNGNGTGTVNIKPNAGAIGFYQGVTITATDNSDSSRSASFDITITDKDVTSVYINFSSGSNAPLPWNNFTAWPSAGATLSNLIDYTNAPTTMSVTLVNGFEGVAENGMMQSSGKGAYPDVVMRTAEYESSTTVRTIRIAGLSASKKYNFVFFNSHEDGLNGTTNFTINNQTVTLNATYNINKTVQINGISPDQNGQVIISVAKDAAADYAYLSSIVVQSYNNTLSTLSPADLKVIGTTRNTASLQWSDRAFDETGYEIWRATSTNSNYVRIGTVPANTTTFTDVNLTTNTTYFYTVRAAKNSTYSDYSNVAAATTLAYSVYVNYTFKEQAPYPWNNTGITPQKGYVWHNFLDETKVPTNVGMVQTSEFDGLYNAGMNTGNNSGIFPDSVMIGSYGLFPGNSATLTITGLSALMKYNFTFFASSQSFGDVTTAYTVNNQTVYLNTSLNTSGTVTIYGITPDENGEVIITVAPGTPTSQFGLIGALIINSYTANTNSNMPQPPATGRSMIVQSSGARAMDLNKEDKQVKISAYPNPFTSSFTLTVDSDKTGNVTVSIYDMSGKLVYLQNFDNVIKGTNSFEIRTNQNISLPGVYVVKVLFGDKKTFKVLKMVKH